MIDEKGLTTEKRTVYFAALLVENMRRRFKVSDDNMDELAAGALQVSWRPMPGTKRWVHSRPSARADCGG